MTIIKSLSERFAPPDAGDEHPWDAAAPDATSATRATRATRVVVESPDGAMQYALEQILRRDGFDVRCCNGPSGSKACPLVASCDTAHCALVADADLVINLLGLHHESTVELVRRLRDVHPETPVLLEVLARDATHEVVGFDTVHALAAPIHAASVLGAVHAVAPTS
jgi:DNA-binding response OmpR family regulator